MDDTVIVGPRRNLRLSVDGACEEKGNTDQHREESTLPLRETTYNFDRLFFG
jgi:hypothetical protein